MLHKVPQTLTFRIWQLAALAMIAVVALCFTTYWHLDNTQDADHEVAETLQVLREMNRLGRYTSDAQSAHLRFALVGRDEYLISYELWISLAKAHLNVVRPLLTNTAGQQSNFDELSEAFWASFRLADGANSLISDGRRGEAVELIGGDQSNELSTALQARWETVTEVERGRLENRRRDAAVARSKSLIILGIAGLLILLLLAVVAASVARNLRRPLVSLTSAITAMAAGDGSASSEVVCDDEIGRVAVAFNEMSARTLQAGRDLEESNTKLRTTSEELRARNCAIGLMGKMAHRLNVASDEVEFTDVLSKIVPQILPDMPGGLYFINNSRNLLILSAAWGTPELPEQFEQDDCWALRRGSAHVGRD